MANQFTQGVLSAYVNGIFVPATEEITWKPPITLNKFAESNMGPLSNVLTWSKEAGTIGLTIVHYSNFDYDDLFTGNSYFNITLNYRSGDILTVSNAILAEAPSNTSIAGTTEVSFSFMNYDFTSASE